MRKLLSMWRHKQDLIREYILKYLYITFSICIHWIFYLFNGSCQTSLDANKNTLKEYCVKMT